MQHGKADQQDQHHDAAVVHLHQGRIAALEFDAAGSRAAAWRTFLSPLILRIPGDCE